MSERYLNRMASDRLDVLEDELPHTICQVRGCSRRADQAGAEWAGMFGRTFVLCSRHRPLYRKHDRILSRIRRLSDILKS
jgi:hypothetical protein